MNSQIPNILTISRLVIIVFFPLMLVYVDITSRWIFLGLYTLAAITDFLDGYFARIYNIGSNFGRVMDPIADKVLILTLCIVILVRDTYFASFLVIPMLFLLIRELIVSGIREALAENNIQIKVSTLAKYKTGLQLVGMGFLIMGGIENWFYITAQYIGLALIILALAVSLISAIIYIKNSYKIILKN
jgi:cardiolipin synthase